MEIRNGTLWLNGFHAEILHEGEWIRVWTDHYGKWIRVKQEDGSFLEGEEDQRLPEEIKEKVKTGIRKFWDAQAEVNDEI